MHNELGVGRSEGVRRAFQAHNQQKRHRGEKRWWRGCKMNSVFTGALRVAQDALSRLSMPRSVLFVMPKGWELLHVERSGAIGICAGC